VLAPRHSEPCWFLPERHLELIPLGPRRRDMPAVAASSGSYHRLRLRATGAMVLRSIEGRDCCWAMLPGATTSVRYLGTTVPPRQLLLAGPGIHVDLFMPSGAAIDLLIIEMAALPAAHGPLLRSLAANAPDAAGLVQLARRGATPERLRRESPAQQFQRAHDRSIELGTATSSLRVAAVLAACRLLEKGASGLMPVREIARRSGVAERTLEYGFRQLYDTTPLCFIRSRRLARSRQLLLDADLRTTVGEAAYSQGFSHMGQFSTDYRRLFGETPSATLARGRASWMQRNPR
jgi:AraC-like DNA-binding protein